MTIDIGLAVLGTRVSLACGDRAAGAILQRLFRSLTAADAGPWHLHYRVSRHAGGALQLQADGAEPMVADDIGDLIYLLDKELIVRAQEREPSYYFVHAAAVAVGRRAILLAGASGNGKSTTAWGLLNQGFSYLSDELAPIDLDRTEVHPYPRALGLKQPPPPPWRLPRATVHTRRSLHVPVDALPARAVQRPLPIAAVVFVEHQPTLSTPVLQPVGPAEAAARLYSNGLNQLAHPQAGLPAAAQLCQATPCYRLQTTDLQQSCRLLRQAFTA